VNFGDGVHFCAYTQVLESGRAADPEHTAPDLRAAKSRRSEMDCQPKRHVLVDGALHAVKRLLWPPQCLVCGGAGTDPDVDLCVACRRDLPWLASLCARCAHPLPESAAALVCGSCLRRPPRFHTGFSALAYQPPVDHLIRAFKYRRDTASGRLLAQLFCERLRLRAIPLPDCILPVPLSTTRYRERGFNQAIELGTHLERSLEIPLRADVLTRVRDTGEQAGLKLVERRRNVRGAFAIKKPPAAARVAVLDDVMTTGSTVNEVARILRRAGVEHVEIWAIARASRPG
jgi:ComF family protein